MVIAECVPGNFSYDGREPCRPCPRGYYQHESGQTNCTACSGNSTAQEGSTSSDNCTATSVCFILSNRTLDFTYKSCVICFYTLHAVAWSDLLICDYVLAPKF